MPISLTALELFCGIGGFAAAVEGTNVHVVGALDQSPAALAVYRLNFPEHNARQTDLEKITASDLAGFGADLWWLSPPCQPYSIRGNQKDLADPRAQSLARILSVFPGIPEGVLPASLALENVAGFARAQARERLVELLTARKYEIRERLLCPTELGMPSRRARYYLVASRLGLLPPRPVSSPPRPLRSFLNPVFNDDPPSELLVPADVVNKFGEGFRILDPLDPMAYTTCFTAGYGKSLMHAGSYLRCRHGVRRFAPEEIAGLLGFPETFSLPATLSLRKCWHLLGNSLSVVAVREVFKALPGVNNGRGGSSPEF
ncbi:MAG: DNA cytosine methyltransferase [Desulfuromonadales bacterium]|nr:DNA cytosine methyltransferase [Desulfuromonadales bacterium]